MEELNRRNLLKSGASVGAGIALTNPGVASGMASKQPKNSPFVPAAKPMDIVRVGLIGIGARGKGKILPILLDLEGVELKAVCDIKPDRVAIAQKMATEAGKSKPAGYSRGEYDYRRMCERDDLDLIIVETPWEWHARMCVDAMNAGKHVGTEMPAALTVEDCWKLVETSEKTQRYCTLLENVCYFPNSLMVLNMVRKGLFGEIVHCQGGYQHIRIHNHFDSAGNKLWRADHAIKYDGNLYPTHPLGPMAQWMNINRGDRIDYLVSMSTKSKGINLYLAKRFGADHPSAKQKYAIGDINTTLIKTVNGNSITLYYDTQLPRPYSLIFRVQGTHGLYMDEMKKIYIEDRSYKRKGGNVADRPTHAHNWEDIEKYTEEFKHPLMNEMPANFDQYGHLGGDYIMMYRLIKDLRMGSPLDIDVYDTVTWSSIRPLSIDSVADRSRAVDVPDFTRGKWKTLPPVAIRG